MDTVTNEIPAEELRLSTEQQAEIGDIFLSARAVSRQMIAQAQAQADEILQNAREKADEIVREATEQASGILRDAEARALEIAPAAPAEETPDEAGPPGALSEEMQDYVVRCVGDCFARLRQQQLETADYLNEQWRAFLSGLSLPALPTPGAKPAEEADGGVSRQDIEDRVSAIARELMEIIGK